MSIRIKKKYFRFVMAFFVVIPVSATMSFSMRVWHHGFSGAFFEDWLRGFGKGIVIAYPSVIFFVWVAQKIMDQLDWVD